MADISSWADMIIYSPGYPEYAWTRPLHFVDSEDCKYDDDRDCPDGKCVIGAISNFTTQAACTGNLWPRGFRSDALKFLVHFIGDLSQPLHTCGRQRGGNAAVITFDGHRSNLHSIWDTFLVRKRIIQVAGDQSLYKEYLLNQIKNGTYKEVYKSWIAQYPIDRLNHNGNSLAVIYWANDTDSFNCDVVWGPYDTDPKQDFGDDYFLQVAGIIDLQIAKAGVRLADWLNNLFEAC